MSEYTSWPAGTPSWADHSSPDPGAAASFYGDLLGWETEDRMPPDAEGEYHVASLRGKDVAACGSQPMEGMPPVWNTYVTVDSADETAERARAAGGRVIMDPFDVLAAGRMAVLADPAGAVCMCWEPKDMIGAELAREPGTLAWNELTTRDVDGSKRFYGAVFGWTTTAMQMGDGEYTIFHRDGEEAGVGGMMPMVGDQWPADLPPHWMVYFSVDDADAVAARCEELGGKVSVAPFDASGVGRIAVLNDPQGAVFSVIEIEPQDD